MGKVHNSRLVPYAQKLRNELTTEEKKLWYDFIRKLPTRFIRQKIIGDYIVDFYCASKKLIIELDGSQHYEDKEKDRQRDTVLSEQGYTVLRYTNYQIWKEYDVVCRDIAIHLGLE